MSLALKFSNNVTILFREFILFLNLLLLVTKLCLKKTFGFSKYKALISFLEKEQYE